MRPVLLVQALVGLSCLAFAPAEAAECFVSGTYSAWGADTTLTVAINAGQSCTHGFRIRGVVYSSRIASPPRHGSAKLLNISTMEYRAAAGYSGSDSFVIEARGSAPGSSGTSNITIDVVIQ